MIKAKTSASPIIHQIPIAIAGGGRIGGAVSRRLVALGFRPEKVRLKEMGIQLSLLESVDKAVDCQNELSVEINKLVVCVAPSKSYLASKEQFWRSLFEGALAQHKQGKLTIKQLIFVSSTRVFDGYQQGIVDASTTPLPVSARAKSLLVAESAAVELASHTLILRCGGLYGSNYKFYTDIMEKAQDRPRCGTAENDVIERLVELMISARYISGVQLLTDSKVYWQGRAYDFDTFVAANTSLVQSFPLLADSEDITYFNGIPNWT